MTRCGPGPKGPAWTPCACGDFWCSIHRKHAHDCPCPPADEWATDPYSEPAQAVRKGPRGGRSRGASPRHR